MIYSLVMSFKCYFSLQEQHQIPLFPGAYLHIPAFLYISRIFLYLSVLSASYWAFSCSAHFAVLSRQLSSFIQHLTVLLYCLFFTHTQWWTQWFWQTINRHFNAANLACCSFLHVSSVLVDSSPGVCKLYFKLSLTASLCRDLRCQKAQFCLEILILDSVNFQACSCKW